MTESAWQPIETAPKDGRDLLVFEGSGMCVANWDDWKQRNGQTAGWRDGQCYPVNPTHWMPLPQPPANDNPKASSPEATQQPEVIERTSPSPLEAVYATEEFKREWAKEQGQPAPSESEEK